jgi:hypothetical protein
LQVLLLFSLIHRLTIADAPEFLNRIDEFIVFKRLSIEALRDIVDIRLNELQLRLKDRRITLEVDDDVRSWLAERGYDPKFGARPVRNSFLFSPSHDLSKTKSQFSRDIIYRAVADSPVTTVEQAYF